MTERVVLLWHCGLLVDRLLHSPNLLALGQSVVQWYGLYLSYDTDYVIGKSIYGLGDTKRQWGGSCHTVWAQRPVGISAVFHRLLEAPGTIWGEFTLPILFIILDNWGPSEKVDILEITNSNVQMPFLSRNFLNLLIKHIFVCSFFEIHVLSICPLCVWIFSNTVQCSDRKFHVNIGNGHQHTQIVIEDWSKWLAIFHPNVVIKCVTCKILPHCTKWMCIQKVLYLFYFSFVRVFSWHTGVLHPLRSSVFKRPFGAPIKHGTFYTFASSLIRNSIWLCTI